MSVTVTTLAALRNECAAATASDGGNQWQHHIVVDAESFALGSTPLVIDHPVCIDFQGCHLTATANGIEIESGAQPSTLRNFQVEGDEAGTGIRVRAARVTLENFESYWFALGLHVDGNVSQSRNANFLRVRTAKLTGYRDSTTQALSGTALKTEGADSAACVFEGVLFTDAALCVEETAAKGNTFVGCWFEGATAFIDTESGNYSTWLGTGIEGSALESGDSFLGAGAIIGSTLVNACKTAKKTFDRVGRNASLLGMRRLFSLGGSEYETIAMMPGVVGNRSGLAEVKVTEDGASLPGSTGEKTLVAGYDPDDGKMKIAVEGSLGVGVLEWDPEG